MTKRTESAAAGKPSLRPVDPAPAPKKEPSRMMGLLIVDVLAARKVTPPVAKKPATKKSERA